MSISNDPSFLNKNLNQKIVFVVGSTASGKSQWAMSLAKKYNGSIVNIDSIQFYEGLVVGSAAPSLSDKSEVPHYLYNYIQAPQTMTAGEFLREFYLLLDQKKTKDKIKFPLFVVGGTGFYIQALEKGMFNIPEIDPELKKQIEAEINSGGLKSAYQELIDFDPTSRIHENDAYRIGRALEVKRAFGRTMSQLQSDFESAKKFELKIPHIKVGKLFEKEVLLKNVQQRTELMLKNGIIEEAENFIKLGFSDWAPLKSVGYFEVMEYLENKCLKVELADKIVQSTMQLIKKQKTWFKRDPSILWSTGEIQTELQIEQKIDQFLS